VAAGAWANEEMEQRRRSRTRKLAIMLASVPVQFGYAFRHVLDEGMQVAELAVDFDKLLFDDRANRLGLAHGEQLRAYEIGGH